MICPNCGKEIVENSRFCNFCGVAIDQINKNLDHAKTHRKIHYSVTKKSRAVFLLIMLLMFFCCVIAGLVRLRRIFDMQKSLSERETEYEDKTNDDNISKKLYVLAEYDRFESSESENSLLGTFIYVDGVVKGLKYSDLSSRKQEGGVYFLSVIDDTGEEWLACFNDLPAPIVDEGKLNIFFEKKIRVYGSYIGQSIDYEKPIVEVHEIDDGENIYKITDVLSNSDWIKKWCDNNECDLCVDEISASQNNHVFGKTVGIVDELWTDSNQIRIITRESTGKFISYVFDMSSIFREYQVDLNTLDYQKKDYVAIYYQIYDGVPKVLGISHIEDVGFGSYNRFQFYKDNCVTCEYNDLARNPASMKGKMIRIKGQVWVIKSDGNRMKLIVYAKPWVEGIDVYNDGEIVVTYDKNSGPEDNILVKDIVTIYGWVKGENTTETTYSNGQPVIDIEAEYIIIQD